MNAGTVLLVAIVLGGAVSFVVCAVLAHRHDQAQRPVTLDDLQALLPDAALEAVGERAEIVIYTGLTVEDDDVTLRELTDAELSL